MFFFSNTLPHNRTIFKEILIIEFTNHRQINANFSNSFPPHVIPATCWKWLFMHHLNYAPHPQCSPHCRNCLPDNSPREQWESYWRCFVGKNAIVLGILRATVERVGRDTAARSRRSCGWWNDSLRTRGRSSRDAWFSIRWSRGSWILCGNVLGIPWFGTCIWQRQTRSTNRFS